MRVVSSLPMRRLLLWAFDGAAAGLSALLFVGTCVLLVRSHYFADFWWLDTQRSAIGLWSYHASINIAWRHVDEPPPWHSGLEHIAESAAGFDAGRFTPTRWGFGFEKDSLGWDGVFPAPLALPASITLPFLWFRRRRRQRRGRLNAVVGAAFMARKKLRQPATRGGRSPQRNPGSDR